MPEHVLLGGEQQGEGQDLKEETVNDAFNRFGHGPILRIQDRDLTAPPGGEGEGESWLVDTPATGAWESHEGEVATWFSGWRFRALLDGECLVILGEGGAFTLSMWYNDDGSLTKMWEV